MRVACVQFCPEFGDAAANASFAVEILEKSAADILVFPEAALTGYCVSTREQAMEIAICEDSEALLAIEQAAKLAGKHAIVGFAERDGSTLYNSAAFFGPEGTIGIYRKTHVPFLGIDRFIRAGGDAPVFDSAIGKIAIAICFDVRFPELIRSYALRGAELVCVPTNWPDGAEGSSDFVCPTRSIENQVFIAAANRVGTENGFRFVGKSKIIAPGGTILASAEHADAAIIEAECDLSLARSKRVVKIPGAYELDLWGARRPEIYTGIISSSE